MNLPVRFFAVLCSGFICLSQPMALAEPTDSTTPENAEKTQSNNDSSQPSSRTPILRELKDLYHSLGQLQKNARGLSEEYNRSDVRILEYGDFIEEYIDDKPVPFQESLYPYGFQNMGNTGTVQGPPLPPRKQWVEHYMGNLKELLSLVKNELNDVFGVAASVVDKEESDQCNKLLSDLSDAISTLEKMTALDKPDKATLQKTISHIIDDAHLLQLTTKKAVRGSSKH